MGDKTSINWTNYTFNPWWGCDRVSPGCDNCYAAALDKRTGGDYWNPRVKPRRTKTNNWNKVISWQKKAKRENVNLKVFCGSMMDWCDKNSPEGALTALWELIRNTPNLTWQLLTKRASLIQKCLPEDWGEGYDNVWLGVTVEDVDFGGKRLDIIKKIPAKVKFLSCEPLLEDISELDFTNIDWVIIGGESGPGFRPMKKKWAISLIEKCENLKIPVWFKQNGGNTRNKGGILIDAKIIQNWPHL